MIIITGKNVYHIKKILLMAYVLPKKLSLTAGKLVLCDALEIYEPRASIERGSKQ